MRSDLGFVRSELRARRAPGRPRRFGDRFRFQTDGLVNRMALVSAPPGRKEIVMRTAAHLRATSKGVS